MVARDFIEEVRVGLQEKSTHWKDRELFLKLGRAYNLLQFDLPYFTCKESIEVKQDDEEIYLTHEALKNISLHVNGVKYRYANIEHLYHHGKHRYSFLGDKVLFTQPFLSDGKADVHYMYGRRLKTLGCVLMLPPYYMEALRLLFLSFIYEKPTINTKQRNLSAYYKKEYVMAINGIPKTIRTSPKNVKSIYQKV